MFCQNCGTQNDSASKFCLKCGSQMPVANNNMNMQQPVQPAQQPQQAVDGGVGIQPNQSNPAPQEFSNPNQQMQQPMNNQQPNNMNYAPQSNNNDNKKVFKILSYLGILWLVGIFAEKNDADVRFHVGQGMILFITNVVLVLAIYLINNFVIANIFKTEAIIFGIRTGAQTVSATGLFLMGLLSWGVWIAILVLAIMGIVNANKDENKPLPVIGNMAFYK